MAHSEIYIGSLTEPDFYFSDQDVRSISGNTSVDLMSDKMVVDEMEPSVEWDRDAANSEVLASSDDDYLLTHDYEVICTSYQGTDELTTIPYGTPVWFRYDNELAGKFYLKEIERTGPKTFRLALMSCVGLLDNLADNGGMFSPTNSDTFRSVLAGILGGTVGSLSNGMYPITGGVFDCFVEQQAGVLPISGWLPIGTKRENLHQLLFAESVALTKAADGTPVFAYVYTQPTPETIADQNIYVKGSVKYGKTVTAVNITEHTYIDRGTADTLATLYDSSASGMATNLKVEFGEPMHDLDHSTLTLHESGANYAIISGNGTLKGYKYTHSKSVIRREIAGSTAETNEKNVTGVTLINPLNSSNVADRAADYYSKAVTVNAEVKVQSGTPKAGRQYSFTDPFGDQSSGFVTEIELSASNILKANCKIITDYEPRGQGNNYSQAELKTAGNWTVPEGITKARLVLIGGGQGGTSGTDGTAGSQCELSEYVAERGGYTRVDTTKAVGGNGGTGGTGGTGGKVLTVDLTNLQEGDVIALGYGAQGQPGGGNGGNTTATINGTTYTSNDGTTPSGGVLNIFSGELYATQGRTGYGGAGGGTYNARGGSLTVGVSYWNGGEPGEVYRDREASYGIVYTNYYYHGGGGGAAYGKTGKNGRPYDEDDANGNGGNGANANAPSDAMYGCGGAGGNGGGGGGGGGFREFSAVGSGVNVDHYEACAAGSGGTGSAGGKGGAGCVLIYY